LGFPSPDEILTSPPFYGAAPPIETPDPENEVYLGGGGSSNSSLLLSSSPKAIKTGFP
jgi:hypothetical protein